MPPEIAEIKLNDGRPCLSAGRKKTERIIKMKIMFGAWPKIAKCGRKLPCRSVKKYRTGIEIMILAVIFKNQGL